MCRCRIERVARAGDDQQQHGRGRSQAPRECNIPEYQGLRTARYAYVEYATGERELYDLTNDPDELDNLATTANAALLAAFHQRLDELRPCKADVCRTSEAKPLALP